MPYIQYSVGLWTNGWCLVEWVSSETVTLSEHLEIKRVILISLEVLNLGLSCGWGCFFVGWVRSDSFYLTLQIEWGLTEGNFHWVLLSFNNSPWLGKDMVKTRIQHLETPSGQDDTTFWYGLLKPFKMACTIVWFDRCDSYVFSFILILFTCVILLFEQFPHRFGTLVFFCGRHPCFGRVCRLCRLPCWQLVVILLRWKACRSRVIPLRSDGRVLQEGETP